MNQVVLQLLNGLVVGSSLALVASGLALQFGVLDILNLAQGDFLMLAGYALWLMFTATGNFVLSAVVAIVLVGVVGGLLLVGVCWPLLQRSQILVVLLTLGLSLMIEQGATNIFGASPRPITPPFKASIPLGPIVYPVYDLVIVASGVVVLVLCFLGLRFTRYGIWLRGVAQNRLMAALLGVPVRRVYVVAFIVSTGLAAIAGTLLVPMTSVYPTVGSDMILTALIVVVAGGLGSIKGAAAIAFLIGEVESVGSLVVKPVALEILLFALVIVVMIGRTRRGRRELARL